MKKKYLISLLAVGLTFFSCGRENLERTNPLDPQYHSQDAGIINGYVKWGSINLSNATVSLVGTNRSTLTDNSGRYSFSNAPTGNVSLIASCPWYQDNMQSFTLTSGQQKNIDFSLITGRPSIFPCTFNYTSGSVPPSPWTTFTSLSSSPTVDTYNLSAPYGCKLTCGNAVGNYTELRYSGLNALKGVKVKAAINVSTTSCSVMVKLKDITGFSGPEIGIYNNNFYLVTPSGSSQTIGGAPAASTYYFVEIVYEADIRQAVYTVYNASGSVYGGPVILNNTSIVNIDRVSIVNTATNPSSMTAYIDDVDVVKK